MLDSGFSKQGHDKFDVVLMLEGILRKKEGVRRDPAKYHVAIFGKPGTDPWGWRIEGHHFSAHFTSVDKDVIAVTPNFVGATPLEVEFSQDENWEGFTPLQTEGMRANTLIAMLQFARDQKFEQARLPGTAPQDVLLDPSRSRLDGTPVGVRASDLTPTKRARLLEIVDAYFDDLSTELAARERARFAKHPLDQLYFAWAGDPTTGAPLYWRVQGAYFAIEFVYARGDTDHAHRIWRDFERDFGGDALREHLREAK